MPQMTPLMWLSLFILFSVAFMLFNMMNYYLFNAMNQYSYQYMSTKTHKQSKNMLNWKWYFIFNIWSINKYYKFIN